eukprot:TRINITY_DN5035_c0_g1_i3.p3 TRINITY_DN5035_c0_g1~~TRINITY_DN5035_c0_g1_i3.p3  ORF type:complete len:118 (+),score=49.27 TRINITY_DN5035_c0_g1_i3:62-415(+)
MVSLVDQEVWVDAPRLWANLAGVLSACVAGGLVDFDVLCPMVTAFGTREDDVEVVVEFLRPTLQALEEAEFTAYDAEKAARLMLAVQKAQGKKGKKGPRPPTMAELLECLDKSATTA